MAERLCPIASNAQFYPQHPAVITSLQRFTYRDCDAILSGLVTHLKSLNIKSGARVAFVARSHPSTIFLFFALFRCGAIACPLSFREPREKIDELVAALDAFILLEPEKLPLCSAAPSPCSLFDESLATFVFTSGSSNTPKIACHTLGNHFSNALGVIDYFSLTPECRWSLALPLFHVSGIAILFRMFLSGGSVVLSDLPILESASHFQITHLSLVPTQLQRLLREPNFEEKMKYLSCLLVGGAPMPPTLFQEALNRNLPLYTTYGMTEMSSIITAAKYPTSQHMGKVLSSRELTIGPDHEIRVTGDTLFSGYWDKNTRDILPNRIDGWFPTRDLGAFTPQGDLYILGRKDRQFISGGENIYPEEIERALCSIPGIIYAQVIPENDPEFGQRPIAFIHDETQKHTLESIRTALKPLLPSFKHPIRIQPVTSSNNFKHDIK